MKAGSFFFSEISRTVSAESPLGTSSVSTSVWKPARYSSLFE